MRSALICVFFALVVQKEGGSAENDEDFKPTPIPLNNWPSEKQGVAGTLQDIIKTEEPPTVAAVPAHYWEDALRHSVYLTLVRDKIDQLIAKGALTSPDSTPDHKSKEVDDRDLWEKIKTARFDRMREKAMPPDDVTILAKGRLLEDNEGFRFAEEDASQNNCSKANCTKGVKAYWSVKRVRQGETSSGKYHYELTFSVTSQTSRKLKKPYENPVRTFTIKENSPTEHPETRSYEQIQDHVERPQRAIWVHKNIGAAQIYHRRPPHTRGLDRIFSSLFSDEDSYEEPSYRHKHKTYVSQTYPHHAKVGYVDDRELYHHKKQIPYPILKPHSFRYTHPPIPPPPLSYIQHPYLNVDSIGNYPYPSYSDIRNIPSNAVKTTRPAVLPTPITNYPLLKESTIEVSVKTKLNATEYTTKKPDESTTFKIHNHFKQPPMKVSYFTDHVRPPVYNAPPGVFVTMDKKPFKPMPPLKFMHSNKPQKNMPSDFRPSPQVHDTQFSDPESTADTAFRPITMDYTEVSTIEEANDNSKKGNKNIRKPSVAKKAVKKHEHIKPQHLTTVIPKIITAQSVTVEEDNSMEWANLLGAFTKTTPMASQREKSSTESFDLISTTTPSLTTTTEARFDDTEDYSEEVSKSTSSTTTTTAKPKKRTRPPPQFLNLEKIKKHKRVTSTNTTTTKPIRKYPVKNPSDDLTPPASSAATSGANSVWETISHKASTTTTTTTSTTPRPTSTTRLTTTSTSSTTATPSTTVDTEQAVATTQPKSKNRFRQSTLMQKGTSVNHDKWSAATLEKNRTNPVTNIFPLRRKASKFQGYIPSSTPRSPEVERDRNDHQDHAFNLNKENIISTTTEPSEDIPKQMPQPTHSTVNDPPQKTNNDLPPEWNHEDETEELNEEGTAEKENNTQEFKDGNEYIFPTAPTNHKIKPNYISLEKQLTSTDKTIATSVHSATKNKTKCKKKKHNNLTTTEGTMESSSDTETNASPTDSSITTTESTGTSDIFEQLFGGFTMDDATEKPKTEHSTTPLEPSTSKSEKNERYIHIDDDIEDFLHSLDKNSNHHAENYEEYNDDDDDDDDDDNDDKDSPFSNDDDNLDSRNFSDEYYDNQESQEQSFSLLKLMTME